MSDQISPWTPIQLPTAAERDYSSHETRQLAQLARAWASRCDHLRTANPTALQHFLEKVVRSWAIETGVLERAYDVSEGTTETLIERGLSADLIARGETDIDPIELVVILQDHVAAARLVHDLVSEQQPMTLHFVRELHQLLTRRQEYVEAQTADGTRVRTIMQHGSWKTMPNNAMRLDGTPHVYAPPEHVEMEMRRLLDGYSQLIEGPPSHTAAWLHHRFTQIHPFQDGNGRVARALTNAVFIKADLFPLLIHRRHRAEYLSALESADRGDLTVLIDLFAATESETILQALSLSDEPERAPSVDDVVDRVVTRLADRLRDRLSAYRGVNGLAVALRDHGCELVTQLAHRAAGQLEPTGLELRVLSEVGGSDLGTEHWWKNAVLDAARADNYWVNFQEGQYWFQTTIRNAPIEMHFVVSLHHVGRDLSGVMRAHAFAEFDLSPASQLVGRIGERQERVRKSCAVQPFLVTWQSTKEEVTGPYANWLGEAFALGLRHWLDLF